MVFLLEKANLRFIMAVMPYHTFSRDSLTIFYFKSAE